MKKIIIIVLILFLIIKVNSQILGSTIKFNGEKYYITNIIDSLIIDEYIFICVNKYRDSLIIIYPYYINQKQQNKYSYEFATIANFYKEGLCHLYPSRGKFSFFNNKQSISFDANNPAIRILPFDKNKKRIKIRELWR